MVLSSKPSSTIGTNNGTINWSSKQNKEWIEGEESYNIIDDDKYIVTGSSNGNATNGDAFNVEITRPLTLDLNCLTSCVIKSGEAINTINGQSDRMINYGDTLCDCNFNVTLNGTKYPIVID